MRRKHLPPLPYFAVLQQYDTSRVAFDDAAVKLHQAVEVSIQMVNRGEDPSLCVAALAASVQAFKRAAWGGV